MPPTNIPPSSLKPDRPADAPKRVIPPPGNVLVRTFFLLIDPAAWPRAAMYGFRTTLAPLVLVSLVMASIVAINGCHKMYGYINAFAATYSSHYDPMVLSDGKLKVIPTPGKKPLHYVTPVFAITYSTKTHPPRLSHTELLAVRLTPGGYYIAGNGLFNRTNIQPYKNWQQIFARALGLPLVNGKTAPVPINSQNLLLLTHRLFYYFVIMAGMILSLLGAIGMVFWAALAMVFSAPLIALVNIELRMPLRVAYRIACAVMVPMTVVRAILLIYNVLPSVPRTITQEMLPFVVPVGISIWAAFMARKMYRPSQPSRPPRQ
jgi:hypothetical protein